VTSALAITLYTRGNSGAQLSKVLFYPQIDVKDYKSGEELKIYLKTYFFSQK
jgi:hypothetical protein